MDEDDNDQSAPTTDPSVGTVALVGAGPGDPGLLTLRAKALLERADVVVYDYLANPAFLRFCRPGTELIYAGKKAGDHVLKQGETNALLITKARAGKRVVRLKGGDPTIFGRGGEEAEELAEAGISFEIVPGISSTIAGPAYAGIPVTHRAFNTHLTLFTGHEDPTKQETTLDYASIAKAPGTKVMLMGVDRMAAITAELIKHGAAPSTPITLIRWATTPRQEVLEGTLENIAERIALREFKAPAVAVIGEVASLRQKIAWFDKRPLFGKRIVVTRTREQASALSDQLAEAGADVLEIPVIKIIPPHDEFTFGELVQDCHKYEWIIFTSPNGVERFFDMFFKLYQDVRSIGGTRLAAIGNGTAARIRENRLAVDLIPSRAVAEDLVEELIEIDGTPEHRLFLVVRPAGGRDVIAATLTKAGAIVDEAIAYQTVPETEDPTGARERFTTEGADILTFASSSAVDHFMALGLPMPPGVKIASIGPLTSQSLRAHKLKVDIEAKTHDIPGLIRAIKTLAQK
jgi:uroporphyrinogen III methyltransferase / synthase